MKTDHVNGAGTQAGGRVQDRIDEWEWLWPSSEDASAAAQAGDLSASSWTSTRLSQEAKGKRLMLACKDDEIGIKVGRMVAQQCLKYKAAEVRLWPVPDYGSKHADLAEWRKHFDLRRTIEFVEPWSGPEYRFEVEPAEPTPEPNGIAFPRTDRGNAERLAARHGTILHHCHPWGKWLVYDSRRWRIDDTGMAQRLAKETTREILVEAAALPEMMDRQGMVKWWHKSESRARIESMLSLAASEEGIPVLPDALNADPWLLNVENGTLDLRSGILRGHSQGDMITALAPVTFDTAAECPLWVATLDRIFDSDADLIGFWQRLCGLCLTGLASEQILPILYGTGANGKSTILGALLGLLGPDYAAMAPPGLLMLHRGEQHPTERAILYGKRLVVDMESGQGARLNETMVKQLTGSDRISARRMREDFWDFAPTHKLMLCTNHRPEIRETKNAIWRRIKLVPFSVAIPEDEQIRDLPEQLKGEISGILNWCLRGCLDWKKGGLGVAERVVAATEGYRTEEDTLGTFIQEHCVVIPSARVKSRNLYDAWRNLTEGSTERTMSQKAFGMAMTERGFERFTNNGTWYRGIGLRSEDDADWASQVS